MRKSIIATGFATAIFAIALFGQNSPKQAANNDLGYTDTPILPGLPYGVHDPARPHPRVVTPAAQPGAPPSDAIVLFDGKDLSKWDQSRTDRGSWKVENGYFEVVPGGGNLSTKEKFGDVQLHVEWAAPAAVRGNSQNRGNSGIFLQGRYEVQVLDSYQNPTYADGQAGALYGQWPPLVNATRKPGEWQAYDIVFEAPKIEDGKVVKPASMTVFLNGVLLHNRKELMGPTVHRQLAKYVPQLAEDSLVLQDHQQPVRYRNIWIRRLGTYDEPEWLALFNGKDLEGWHVREVERPNGWKVVGDAYVNTPPSVDIQTDREFYNFDLHVEFKITPGGTGNSGVYMRDKYEIQILDSFGKPPATDGCGALYKKIAPAVNASKPAGEWQALDIHFVGRQLTVVHNGHKILDDVDVGPMGTGAASNRPDGPGPLRLQGDHDAVSFRNVRIRPIQ